MKYISTTLRGGMVLTLSLGTLIFEAGAPLAAQASVQISHRSGAVAAQTISPGLWEAYWAEPIGSRGQAPMGAINWNGDWLDAQ